MAERRRRPTLRDIAAETGLSTAAVSYALRGLQVPPETQQRVREAAERLGYQADPIARALASGRTGYVGVLCRSLEDIWQQGLATALGRGLLEAGRSPGSYCGAVSSGSHSAARSSSARSAGTAA